MSLNQRFASLATGRGREVLVATVAFALVIAIGWTLATWAWLMIDGVPAALPGGVVAPATTAPTRKLTPEIAQGWALFGDASSPSAAGEQALPETNLSLQLLGIFSTNNVKLAGAVIAERGKAGELFRAGATLPGGATLEKVEKDQVLLRRRGQLETLRFDAPMAAMPDMDARSADRHAERKARRKDASTAETRDGDIVTREPGNALPDNPADQRAMANRFMDDFRASPDIVLNDVGLTPASGGGYSVGAGANAELLRRLGLRPGDVVLTVNGKTIGNAQADANLVDEVKASGEARVEVRRGSQTFTVNYPL